MWFSFTVQELAQIDLLWNFVEDQGLQERRPALEKRARCESGVIAISSTRCGALGNLKEIVVFPRGSGFLGIVPATLRTLVPESSRTPARVD